MTGVDVTTIVGQAINGIPLCIPDAIPADDNQTPELLILPHPTAAHTVLLREDPPACAGVRDFAACPADIEADPAALVGFAIVALEIPLAGDRADGGLLGEGCQRRHDQVVLEPGP
ncbi:hypothetical protein ACSDBR_10010 [Acidithiobacillus ferriphilus]|uniref:hypothetical protein n=1 Tax=Acidithiobacillus ferriphilus TaxID=1689834 RepID=UPI003F510CC7